MIAFKPHKYNNNILTVVGFWQKNPLFDFQSINILSSASSERRAPKQGAAPRFQVAQEGLSYNQPTAGEFCLQVLIKRLFLS